MSNTEKTVPVIFSLYKDEDYDGFFACIDDFYHGGYPYEAYIDRENLRRLLDRGDIIITLAKTQEGRIVGTSAALRMTGRFDGSVLLLLRCIVKDMRGRGVGGAQELFLLEQIRLHFPEALSLYADVMTHDSVSQSTMLQKGFVFCGLRMALYKNDRIVPTLPYQDGTKMTQAIYCKNNRKTEKRTLFAPQEHRGALRAVYEALGVSVNFCSDDEPGVGDASCETEICEPHKSAEVYVDRHGDIARLIADVGALLLSGYTAVAYINMSLAGCTATYKALSDIGFYFSGVKPLSTGGEYLVLSHSRQCVLVLDDIKLPRETAPLYRTVVKEIKHDT